MEEKIGKRINQVWVNEALETQAEVLAAACPFCITSMFEDSIKGVEAEEKKDASGHGMEAEQKRRYIQR
jgi:Fe-S oxidoreductase